MSIGTDCAGGRLSKQVVEALPARLCAEPVARSLVLLIRTGFVACREPVAKHVKVYIRQCKSDDIIWSTKLAHHLQRARECGAHNASSRGDIGLCVDGHVWSDAGGDVLDPASVLAVQLQVDDVDNVVSLASEGQFLLPEPVLLEKRNRTHFEECGK